MKLFRKKPTIKEQIRISQKELTDAVRELERELLSMDKEEQRLITEIRAAARYGNVKGAKILARSMVRLRGQRTKVLASASQLRSVRTTIGTAAATATTGSGMAKASAAMAAIGRTNNPVALAATMQNFANENAKMDVRQEMINDSLDGALDDGDAEQETDDVMNQVLDEIGVDLSAQLAPAPTKRASLQRAAVPARPSKDVEDVTAQLSTMT